MVELTLNLDNLDVALSNETLSVGSSQDNYKTKKISEDEIKLPIMDHNLEAGLDFSSLDKQENRDSQMKPQDNINLKNENVNTKSASRQEILVKQISESEYPEQPANDISEETVSNFDEKCFVDKIRNIENEYIDLLTCLIKVRMIILQHLYFILLRYVFKIFDF